MTTRRDSRARMKWLLLEGVVVVMSGANLPEYIRTSILPIALPAEIGHSSRLS
jgi:hypothetical protein